MNFSAFYQTWISAIFCLYQHLFDGISSHVICYLLKTIHFSSPCLLHFPVINTDSCLCQKDERVLPGNFLRHNVFCSIVKWIKGQRISWLSHLERKKEDRMPKKIFTQKLERTKRRGRPRKRWEEEVERDLQVLGVRRWRDLVADRKKWKDIFRQAKAHSGL